MKNSEGNHQSAAAAAKFALRIACLAFPSAGAGHRASANWLAGAPRLMNWAVRSARRRLLRKCSSGKHIPFPPPQNRSLSLSRIVLSDGLSFVGFGFSSQHADAAEKLLAFCLSLTAVLAPCAPISALIPRGSSARIEGSHVSDALRHPRSA